MPAAGYLLIGIAAGLLLGVVVSLFWRRPENLQPFKDLETRLSQALGHMNTEIAGRFESTRGDIKLDLGDRLQNGLNAVRDSTERQLAQSRDEQDRRLAATVGSLEGKFQELRNTIDAQLTSLAEKQDKTARDTRAELTGALDRLSGSNEKKLEHVKVAVEQKLAAIQHDNAQQLELMRKTVDEKLQGTLEKRLGDSFRLVSERLELVHKGLGEMQTLASGVGDLKKVLTNVKTRGTWGEMQLGNLLEQLLTPDQYASNVATRAGSSDRVEFAIKLPGRDGDAKNPVWLPIDAKFPKEDYERLIDAAEAADATALESAASQLEARVKLEAKRIREKYVEPPETTDFAILYLPVEGLYAEVLRRPGLQDALQRECRVTVAGPTVLSALLNSLQMGFRTIAIEKRSSEVWTVLAAVKNEFGKFGEIIGKVQKKLQEASNVIDSAATRTKAIERKLRDVHEQPLGNERLPAIEPEVMLLDGNSTGK